MQHRTFDASEHNDDSRKTLDHMSSGRASLLSTTEAKAVRPRFFVDVIKPQPGKQTLAPFRHRVYTVACVIQRQVVGRMEGDEWP